MRIPTVDSATVIAGIRGCVANRRPQEELVVVLVSAQVQTLRFLDGTEDNPHRCRKQETGHPCVKALTGNGDP
jgi:hypothetical protein